MPARPQPGRGFLIICLLALVVILTLRLIPFGFAWDGRVPLERVAWEPLAVHDIPFNTLLFLPLGFGLAGIVARRDPRGSATPALGWRVFAAGVLLSVILELIQLFMPDRVPSVADVAANGLGALAGYGLFRAWEMGFGHALDRAVTRRNLLLGLGFYVLGAALMTAYLNHSVRLDNWDSSFPLVAGNEASGDRPWAGRVDYLELEAGLEGTPDFVARYTFDGDAPFADATNDTIPPLEWRAGPVTPSGGDGVTVGPEEWLATAGGFNGFTEAARRFDRFAIRATVATGGSAQGGPARIASISAGVYERNVTLGQEIDNLIIRMRTTGSSENGERPGFSVPGVFTDGRPRQIAVTYDAPRLIASVDEERYAVTLAPGMAFFIDFNPAAQWTIPMDGNPYRFDYAYWAVVGVLGVILFGGLVAAKRFSANRAPRPRRDPEAR